MDVHCHSHCPFAVPLKERMFASLVLFLIFRQIDLGKYLWRSTTMAELIGESSFGREAQFLGRDLGKCDCSCAFNRVNLFDE